MVQFRIIVIILKDNDQPENFTVLTEHQHLHLTEGTDIVVKLLFKVPVENVALEAKSKPSFQTLAYVFKQE